MRLGADESPAYDAEAPAAAMEAETDSAREYTAQAEGAYEEAAEAEESDMTLYASDNSEDVLTNGKQAASALRDKKSAANGIKSRELTVLAVPDILTLKDDGTIDLKITDPLDSGLKKDEVINVSIKKDENDEFINEGLDIRSIDGSEDRMFRVMLELTPDGKYTLTSIRLIF